MRRTAAEKYALIRLVEGAELPVRRTLRELGVHRSTFYAWYRRYQDVGATGLVLRPAATRQPRPGAAPHVPAEPYNRPRVYLRSVYLTGKLTCPVTLVPLRDRVQLERAAFGDPILLTLFGKLIRCQVPECAMGSALIDSRQVCQAE